jgi:hypothetical protein
MQKKCLVSRYSPPCSAAVTCPILGIHSWRHLRALARTCQEKRQIRRGTHLEVAKVLLAQLHLLLEAGDLGLVKTARNVLRRLAGPPIGAHVEVELVGLPVRLYNISYLAPGLYRLLVPSRRLRTSGDLHNEEFRTC